MTNFKKLCGLILSVVAFAGCSAFDESILVPEQNGLYHAIALDSTEFGAQKSALNRANKTCSDWKLHYIVVSQKTDYRGAGAFTGPVTPSGDPVAPQDTYGKKTAEDYRSVVTFNCVA